MSDIHEDIDNEIEQEFLKSWDSTENFFIDHSPYKDKDSAESMLWLIEELRKRGYDKKLRAGVALNSLKMSRSKKHKLRTNQPFLAIHVLPDGRLEYTFKGRTDGRIFSLRTGKLEISQEVNDLLTELAASEID